MAVWRWRRRLGWPRLVHAAASRSVWLLRHAGLLARNLAGSAVALAAIGAMLWLLFTYPIILFVAAPVILWAVDTATYGRPQPAATRMQKLPDREGFLSASRGEARDETGMSPPGSRGAGAGTASECGPADPTVWTADDSGLLPRLALNGQGGKPNTDHSQLALGASRPSRGLAEEWQLAYPCGHQVCFGAPRTVEELAGFSGWYRIWSTSCPRCGGTDGGAGGPASNGASHRLPICDPTLFDIMPAHFWQDHLMVPLKADGQWLTVAAVDLDQADARDALGRATNCRVQVVAAEYLELTACLQAAYAETFAEESRLGLLRLRPQDSAFRTVTAAQRNWTVAACALAMVAIGIWKFVAVILLSAVVQFFYFGLNLYKLSLVVQLARTDRDVDRCHEELPSRDDSTLPFYSILVPMYREARVLPTLVNALSDLAYPADRLDIKLLLEADDTETISAARAAHLPRFIDVVIVPDCYPKTKPKACNYGLQLARGEYTAVYDAEDIPDSDQLLKAIAAFRKTGPEVACVQAKLVYFNRDQNLLTRWFSAEYLTWFDLLLPSLHAAHLPIPLGGTSNHFRTSVLRRVGGWDPYNVAEDADLGVRLHKDGYRTAVIDSLTYEEATSRLDNWIRQRSRWVKGYMQTWLVHMRHPLALWRSLGPAGFVGFQLIVGGTPLTLLLNPLYALLTTLWYLTHAGWIQALLPSWVYLFAVSNLFLGNLAFTYVNMVAVARRSLWDQLGWVALSPIYWSVMSLAAWKALLQLITRPSYWEKTEHGFAAAPLVAEPAEPNAVS